MLKLLRILAVHFSKLPKIVGISVYFYLIMDIDKKKKKKSAKQDSHDMMKKN